MKKHHQPSLRIMLAALLAAAAMLPAEARRLDAQ